MSSPEQYAVKLSPKARQDFIDILRYIGETWGQPQLLTYCNKINDALQALGRDPLLGHPRVDLPLSHRIYPVGAHLIVYRIDTDSIGVVRIQHQRMSMAQPL